MVFKGSLVIKTLRYNIGWVSPHGMVSLYAKRVSPLCKAFTLMHRMKVHFDQRFFSYWCKVESCTLHCQVP